MSNIIVIDYCCCQAKWGHSPAVLTMCLMAETIWANMSLLSRSDRRPLLEIRENRSPPLPYSIAMYTCLLVSSTSYRRTMFGWLSFSIQMISEANTFCDFLSRRALLRILTATRSVCEKERCVLYQSELPVFIFWKIQVIQTFGGASKIFKWPCYLNPIKPILYHIIFNVHISKASKFKTTLRNLL